MSTPTRHQLAAPLYPNTAAITRIRHLLEQVENGPRSLQGQLWLFETADWFLRQAGIDLRAAGYFRVDDILEMRGIALPEGSGLSLLLAAVWYALVNESKGSGASQFMRPANFEHALNDILAQEGSGLRLRDGAWITAATTDAELLRRILLKNADEAVACKQGDVQVEMVVSTVQAKLGAPNSVVVDYGAGVGRVLAGLATAANFKSAHYIAVDEPMPPDVERLAGKAGAKADFINSREKFLGSSVTADVIMVVNTLHHIPFADIARQIGAVVGKLRHGGILLVHEMGVLRDPEQKNVPWRLEDLITLFQGDAFTCNPRSTQSRTGVPLAHVLVASTGKVDPTAALTQNVTHVWRQMKKRALDEIEALYGSRDPERHRDLQYALITNANLDLNSPIKAQ